MLWRAKLSLLEEAFTGCFTDQHAFLLAKMLARVDALDADLAEFDAKLAELIAGFAGAVERLERVRPGPGGRGLGSGRPGPPPPAPLYPWAPAVKAATSVSGRCRSPAGVSPCRPTCRSPGRADISRPGRCRDRHDGDTGRAQRRLAAASWRPASSKGRPACRLWALGPWTRR